MSQSFARTLSPSISAAIDAFGSVTDGQAAKDVASAATFTRRHAYNDAKSVSDLVECAPVDYRTSLEPAIRRIAELAEKRVNARSALRKAEAAITAGKVPSHLQLKVPTIQAVKEYREAGPEEIQGHAVGSWQSHVDSIESVVKKAQDSIVSSYVQIVKDEIVVLGNKLSRDALFDQLKVAVSPRFSELKESRQEPVYEWRYKVPTINALGESVFEDKWTRTRQDTAVDVRIAGWQDSPTVMSEFQNLVSDLVFLGFRAIAIVEAKDLALQKKIEKKKEIEKSADAEMIDATKPGPSTQSLVDKAVSGRVKSLEAQIKKASGPLSVTAAKKASKPKPDAKKGKPSSAKSNAPAKKNTAKDSTKKNVGKKSNGAGPSSKDKGKGKQGRK
ncbi:hypothetical protein DICSQDRAFT_175293 [Dichomitus squalens LYAD-421 SS1]|uniref:Uncharacterized protein n=1 Tax=Dichomitus squalens (strain LYAD-421) TaxID=732165 RepID=R7SIJ6_DICSQ|nr:uncharacterized protein DICSQDRAFT_175293 [Dichomitus squalens LYAD-421 SS1]EJF55991.1 hypothetical protein DICSQDRAFT_175293 [Dichomitus squalens LYAD-421 SS1]